MALLKRFLPSIPTATVHVLRNLYFGDSEKFELPATNPRSAKPSKARRPVVGFPDLADRVADDLISRRLSVARALRELPRQPGRTATLGKACAPPPWGRSPNLDETDHERDGLQDAAV